MHRNQSKRIKMKNIFASYTILFQLGWWIESIPYKLDWNGIIGWIEVKWDNEWNIFAEYGTTF